MAATYPSGDPDRDDTAYDRPTLSTAPTTALSRSRWVAVAIVVAVLVVIAVVAYFALYSGDSGGTGSGGGQGGAGGGGYFVLAFSGEMIRRVASKLKR
jgi:hypothetical protein